jgi:trk system potassium uptake protein TrkA
MKNQRTTTLHFAVRPRVLFKYTGQLLVVFAFLLIACSLFAVLVQEYRQARNYALISAVSGLGGFFMQRLKAPADLQQNEALVLSALIFILIPLLVIFPFQQAGLSFSNAFFEGVSGITTTGLSTLTDVEGLPRTVLFFRAWLQWIGGLGIVVVSIAILLPHDRAALRLFGDNWQKEDLVTSTKAWPKQSDYLFCLTGNDKDNIIAGLVGRSQGFPKVIIKVEDFALEHICAELGLEDVIVPTRTISRYLTDMISGHDVSELSTAIRGEARFFSFIVNKEYAQKIGELEQPAGSRIICFYRDGDFHLADPDTQLQEDDEVVILTYRDTVDTLKKKWPSVSQEKEENKLKS